MFGNHSCSACMASLQPEDGHDLCPSCLGLEHLKEALSDDACMNCSFMPWAVRAARLAEVEQLLTLSPSPEQLTPAQGVVPTRSGRPKRRAAETAVPTSRKRVKESSLATKVDQLTTEINNMKSLFLTFQSGTGAGEPAASVPPAAILEPEKDVLSMAASATQFAEYEPEVVAQDVTSRASAAGSCSSTHSSAGGSDDGSMGAIIRMALARLQLDLPQAQSAPASAFFRRGPSHTNFTVPPSEEYLRELHACWRDSRTLSHATSDGRTLAAMQDAPRFGLGRMPAIEPPIAALIVSPDEALRPDARCPRPQCRVTDDLLCKAYDAAARMGRIGNSMSHLLLALSASLQETTVDAPVHNFSDASLQAFALMSRELGRLMSTLVQARRQRHLTAQFKPDRLDFSCLSFKGICPLLAALGALQLPPSAGLIHRLIPVAIAGLSAHLHSLPTSRHGVFGPLSSCPLGNLRPLVLPVVPPEPLEAGEPGAEAQGPVVGCFSQQQLSYWAASTRDPWVLSTLTHGYKLQFRRRPPAYGRVKMTIIREPAKAQALSQELSVLLDKGAIEPVDPLLQPGGFYSTYFLVTKKDGRLRPILDLRGLNRFLKVLRFHMLSNAEVLRTVAREEWFTSIDLKDAYFHVPIAPNHRQFLRFPFHGRHYQFRVLPFGLSLSPRVFTRCMMAALSPLQSQGMKVLPYLDDWLICAPSQSQVALDTTHLLSHVARLGLKVNFTKSCLVPSQSTLFLGMTLDSVAMKACPSPQRVDDILCLLLLFQEGRWLRYVEFLRLLGKLTAAANVVPLGLLSLRPLQRWLHSFHFDVRWHRHRRLRVSRCCLLALAPWRERSFLLQGMPLGSIASRREAITTDASLSGWGAVWQNRTAQGLWSARDRSVHINVLELWAVHRALLFFLPFLRGRHVLIRSDNVSTVSHINHQGGTRSAQLLQASRDLLLWAVPRLASLRAMYLPGEKNQAADFLSRYKPPPGEWRLHPEVILKIWEVFGKAEVDLFATEESTHCPLWFSLTEESSPLGQDALVHDWPDSLLYAFPPIPLIFPTLQRVLQQGHRLLLVAPFWPGRTWFPLLSRLCRSSPWRLPDRKDLLSQLQGQIWHPDLPRLQLWVWPLQGPTPY
ncbi:uncharacterized protein LOC125016013 [Mugil cephalus]|uniref:uncharacterized protein LOC125016013 n=1 Tax=Mugil cephalus TaxID=48193 RepID=UPI001FB857BB|nr:uncharacterized protein LOC125016013 [Mugil cephalus]